MKNLIKKIHVRCQNYLSERVISIDQIKISLPTQIDTFSKTIQNIISD